MNWDQVFIHLPKLLEGAFVSIKLVAITVTIGLLLAIPIGIARASRRWYLRLAPFAYIYVFRGTPLLVQLFLVYYGLSQFEFIRTSSVWTGWHFAVDLTNLGVAWHWQWNLPGLRNAFTCALVTMTLHTAAYIAEIIRGAIQVVPRGELEAAYVLGLSKYKTLRFIIMPRAIRIGLPAYSNEVILMLKASALASTITVMELTGVARTLSAKTYLQAEFFVAAGVFYLSLTFILLQVFRLLEKWLVIHPNANA